MSIQAVGAVGGQGFPNSWRREITLPALGAIEKDAAVEIVRQANIQSLTPVTVNMTGTDIKQAIAFSPNG